MNRSRLLRRAVAVLGAAGLVAPSPGALPFPEYFKQRWRGPVVRVRNIEGVSDRIRDGKLYLRLKDFLVLVLKNNTEIQMTRLDVLTAADAIVSAKAPFDPLLGVNFNAMRSEQPQYSQISGADQLNNLYHQGQASYQQTFSSGQTVNVGFSTYRNSSNNRFAFFNPYIATGLNISLTQPLLQDRDRIQLRAPLEIARTQLLITSELSEARIADLAASAARQYWDAVQARDNIRVQQLAVDLAQKSYERDRMALDLGALSPLEIYQSQSQVAQRKVGVIQAQSQYRDLLDSLRRLIGADLDPATRNVEIVLDDDPSWLPASPARPVEEAISQALANRPEMRLARRRIGVDELNARLARNSMLPRFDLGVQFGGAGLGGNQVPVESPLGGGPTTFVAGGLGDALHQLFAFSSPFYGFSIQMTLPVRSSTAQASLADALVNRSRDQYQQRQLEQQIIQEVKSALNQLDTGSQQIEAAKVARDLAQKNVEAQQQKYEIGGITAFELLDAQNRLANVEAALVAAYNGYQKSLIAYQRANWTLLDGMGVLVEVPQVK